MLGDERERGMYDGYGEVMRRCLELPEADVEDWIYGFTHAIWESGNADTEYARGRGIAMDCVTWSLGPTGRELREAIENAWEGNKGMEAVKWIFVVAELAGVALVLVDLVIKEPDDAADSDRLPDGPAGTRERKTPDGRGLAGGPLEGRLRGEGPGMGGPRGSEGVPQGGYGRITTPSRTSSYSAPSRRAIPRRDAWPPSRKGDRHAQ